MRREPQVDFVYPDDAPPREPLTLARLLDEASFDRSTWVDVQHYPGSVTLRRVVRLCNYIAARRDGALWWQVNYLHYTNPAFTQAELAGILGVRRQLVSELLRAVDLSDPSDYPDDEY